MDKIKLIIQQMYNGKISSEEAAILIAHKLTSQQLTEFIVDAFNRGWITKFNLGIEE